jgi:sensor histidine kinase YesM
LPHRDIFFTADGSLDSGTHTLAIHYRDSAAKSAFQHFGAYANATAIGLTVSTEASYLRLLNDIRQTEQFFIAAGAALFLLAVLHILIFVFSPTERAHLFYAIETVFLMYMMLQENVVLFFSPTESAAAWALGTMTRRSAMLLIIPTLVAMLTSLFYPERLSKRHRYLLIGYATVCITGLLLQTLYPLLSGETLPDKVLMVVVSFPTTLGLAEMLRLLIVGVRTSRGAWLIASGGAVFLIAAFSVLSKMFFAGTARISFGIEFILAAMSFQVGMSFFLAWQSAQTRRNLTQSLLEQERERFRAESLAREAAFTALKMQINPHFLFNALASIRTLSRIQPETAHEAISQLSALFRYALQSAQQEIVPLREELSILRDYLALERLRFEDRLQSSFHIPPELEGMPIPPMTLQILVENAVKHGIEEERHGGEIRIHAALEQGELHLRVFNTGTLRHNTRGNGIGLENARERLRMMFGASADITLQEIHRAEGHSDVCAEVRYSPEQKRTARLEANSPQQNPTGIVI